MARLWSIQKKYCKKQVKYGILLRFYYTYFLQYGLKISVLNNILVSMWWYFVKKEAIFRLRVGLVGVKNGLYFMQFLMYFYVFLHVLK